MQDDREKRARGLYERVEAKLEPAERRLPWDRAPGVIRDTYMVIVDVDVLADVLAYLRERQRAEATGAIEVSTEEGRERCRERERAIRALIVCIERGDHVGAAERAKDGA